jgi:hypothetical protein
VLFTLLGRSNLCRLPLLLLDIIKHEGVAMKKMFTAQEAKEVGDKIGIDWTKFDLEQFRMGLAVELEHGTNDPETNVTNDDIIVTGKIAWAHLKEIPDYYTRLNKMESEAGS